MTLYQFLLHNEYVKFDGSSGGDPSRLDEIGKGELHQNSATTDEDDGVDVVDADVDGVDGVDAVDGGGDAENDDQAWQNDREAIRRKLAMGSESYQADSTLPDKYRLMPLQKRAVHADMNLQICFLNDAAVAPDEDQPSLDGAEPVAVTPPENSPVPSSAEAEEADEKAMEKPPESKHSTMSMAKVTQLIKGKLKARHAEAKKSREQLREEDILAKHARLQEEARIALSQAQTMARMQMELEKQKRKKSPIVDMIGLPIDGHQQLVRNTMMKMPCEEVSRVRDDLQRQIQGLNAELVQMLIERDDLHMQQDSMLVDIEDLSKRAQELRRYLKRTSSAEKSGEKPSRGSRLLSELLRLS